MSRYDLIIFDCDGTLLDSELAYNQCTLDLFVEYGLPRYTIEYALQNWLGKALNDIIPNEAAKNKIDLPVQEIIDKFIVNVPAYQEKYIQKIEGALEAVQKLHKKFKCCVASNGEMPNIIASLKIMGYAELFDKEHVFSKDQVSRAKPEPDLFLYACKKMHSDTVRTIVIEDSISGVKAGRAANIYTIGFNGVGHKNLQSEESLRSAGADIVFSDWKDILIHINSL